MTLALGSDGRELEQAGSLDWPLHTCGTVSSISSGREQGQAAGTTPILPAQLVGGRRLPGGAPALYGRCPSFKRLMEGAQIKDQFLVFDERFRSAAGSHPAERVDQGDGAGSRGPGTGLALAAGPRGPPAGLPPRRARAPPAEQSRARTASSMSAYRHWHTTSPLPAARRPASRSAASRLPGAERA